jgi:hypothetical protein
MSESVYIRKTDKIVKNGIEYFVIYSRFVPINFDTLVNLGIVDQYEYCTYLYYIDINELKDAIEEMEEDGCTEIAEELRTLYNIAKEEGIIDNEDYIEIEVL